MSSVVENCPIPILVLGGHRQGSDQDALEAVRNAALAGAAGVFFGRNVFQAADKKAFLRQARSILDGNGVLHSKR
jgi:DhnA family fructose-bisphosphate aldolase class Ia